jgi:putative ABC transport system permease protein
LLLALAGIAIGVAAIVAVDVATGAAQRAFNLSLEAVVGRATHRIAGGSRELDEDLYRRLRLQLRLRSSAPVIEGFVSFRGETLRLLGVDPFADAAFRNYAAAGRAAPLDRFITMPGAVLMSRRTSHRLALSPGQTFTVAVGGQRQPARLLALLQAGRQPAAAVDGLLVADISTAQELLEMRGRLSGIDLRLPKGKRGAQLAIRIESMLPPSAKLERAGARGAAMAQMTHAFVINLKAMSLLALLVGMFLIYSTMTLSVLQRRVLIGYLRALGVTREQIFRLVLLEALGLSTAAVLIGIPAGLALAQGLVGMVTHTINDLYFALEVRQLFVTPATLATGAILGVGASIVAALGPALEAAGTPPRMAQVRSTLEEQVRRFAPRLALAGVAIILLGALLLTWGRSLSLGFVALLLIAMGYALLTPSTVVMMAKAAEGPLARIFKLQGRLAARGVQTSLSRTAVAVAALTVAVATTVGVGIMIESFRDTVAAWLHTTLQADIYIAVAGANGGAGLEPALLQRIAGVPGVAAVSTSRWLEIEANGRRVDLRVVRLAPGRDKGYAFATGEPQAIWEGFNKTQAVLVSEPYAYRRELQTGDTLRLRTDSGVRPFSVAGVFYDYGSQRGVIVIRRGLFDQYWTDRRVSSAGVHAQRGTSQRQLLDRLRAAARSVQHVLIQSNRSLRTQSLMIFDRTFAITQVLRLLAILVAAVGILSALAALQLERAREFAVLRATGFTPAQVSALIIGETGLLGLISGVLAMPLGLVMSLVLIEVINRRSFGWSIQTVVTPEALLQALALALAAALLAGVYPAWRAATTAPAAALRSE